MLKKNITFLDLNGRERTEEHLFNLSKSELARQQIIHSSKDDDPDKNAYMAYIEKEINSGSGKRIMAVFEEIIFLSYGIKDEDEKTFLKSDEISRRFSQTGAYDTFFMQLVTDAEFAAAFFNGIMPPDLVKDANVLKNDPRFRDDMSPSEIARLSSEARMQGHKPVQQPAKTEYPTSIQTPPVVQERPFDPQQGTFGVAETQKNPYEGFPQPESARETFDEPATVTVTQNGTGASVTVAEGDPDFEEFLAFKRAKAARELGQQ